MLIIFRFTKFRKEPDLNFVKVPSADLKNKG